MLDSFFGQGLAIVLVFGALIFFHELGHFVFAKRAGILCREFALGMGPKLFSFKKGETLYTLRIFPIGGFVRMAGEDPEVVQIKTGQEIGLVFDEQGLVKELVVNHKEQYPEAKLMIVDQIDLEHALQVSGNVNGEWKQYAIHPTAHIVYHNQKTQIAPKTRQFSGKTIGQRFATIFAGPAANFVLAIVLLVFMGLIYGVPTDKPILGEVQPQSPAQHAGLQKGDRVLSIDGNKVNSWRDIVSIVSQSAEKPLTFIIEREGREFQVTITPERQEGNVGRIGVVQPMVHSLTGSIVYGLETTFFFTELIFKSLGMLFTGHVSMEDLSGPVGIFNYTAEAAKSGIANLLRWAAILSINLGIFNLLPLPALDGGRLLFLGIEAVRGKPIDPQKESIVHFLGFAFLMVLIIVVTWNDIQRIFLS
jgi:regulator of sigma E protease